MESPAASSAAWLIRRPLDKRSIDWLRDTLRVDRLRMALRASTLVLIRIPMVFRPPMPFVASRSIGALYPNQNHRAAAGAYRSTLLRCPRWEPRPTGFCFVLLFRRRFVAACL